MIKGNFKLDTVSIPSNNTSKSCVRAADFDKDGDLDLFIAGRVHPGNTLNLYQVLFTGMILKKGR